ncbi:hypothetical protein [Paraburkholderia flava]|uniref:hypothetical protein n=1 Tax=Paraburkholderia flava TaxID=2547393 RepID=UPI00105C1B92|nr:hypothetical protein [Paraburkholderia flava]
MTPLPLRTFAWMSAIGCLLASASAFADPPAHCRVGADMLRIRGDVPAAISFDVYQQLQPVNASRLALFQDAGEVKRLHDGLTVCEIADDGVDDPSAVLVHVPRGKMAWWVSAASVQPVDAD